MLPAVTARAKPHGVDRVGQGVSVPLCDRCVSTLRTDMPVRTVASDADALELIARGGNGPRLSERSAPRTCRLADKAVHTAVEMIWGTAPTSEDCLNIPLPPIQTGFRPFNG